MYTFNEFRHLLRYKLQLNKYEVLHIVVGTNTIPAGDRLMRDIYYESRAEDDLLYVTYASESFAG